MPDSSAIFRSLHRNSTPLRLPNAWDAGSARLIESLGAAAIATTSAGLAWSLGFRDGRYLAVDELVRSAARMARVLTVPLSVDIENGYSDDPVVVAQLVTRLIDLGVAGINIEDGPDAPVILAAKIEAISNAISKSGRDVFVNARSDVFLANLVEAPKLVDEAITRGALYAGVGADGLFLPGIVKAADIEKISAAVTLPLNVMALPGLPQAEELGRLGVRRLSAGSGIAQAVWRQAATLTTAFLHNGRSEIVVEDSMPYGRLQELFTPK